VLFRVLLVLVSLLLIGSVSVLAVKGPEHSPDGIRRLEPGVMYDVEMQGFPAVLHRTWLAERPWPIQEPAKPEEATQEPQKKYTHAHSGSEMPFVAKAVAACESGARRADGSAVIGTHDWRADNPRSTASGGFQFLDGTWQRVASRIGATEYARAKHAPPSVQIAAFVDLRSRKGLAPWRASKGCWALMR
jgi:hypothetical protein